MDTVSFFSFFSLFFFLGGGRRFRVSRLFFLLFFVWGEGGRVGVLGFSG